MHRLSWKSVVLDEIHRIREELTKEMSEINTREGMERWRKKNIKKLEKNGYRYEMTAEGYSVLRHI